MAQEALFTWNGKSIINQNGQEHSFTITTDIAEAVEKNYDLVIYNVSWNKVEIAEDGYNEEFLASLRDIFKDAEEKGIYILVNSCFDEPTWSAEGSFSSVDKAFHFIEAMKHTARRVKDCSSVIGFALSPEAQKNLDKFCQDFYEALVKKHKHYLFFVNDAESLENENFLPLSCL